MAIYKKGSYDLYMFQGDTGNIIINGIPKTRDYRIYFQINTMEGEKLFVIDDITSNYHSTVVIPIGTEISDRLPVGQYCYAVKLCYDYSEETVIPMLRNTGSSPSTYKNKALFLVYPKQIEGNEQW